MTIHQLIDLIPPPAIASEVPESPNWTMVENEIGAQLPGDYKAFVTHYGSGLLGNFIRVYNPFASSEYLSLIERAHRQCELLRDRQRKEGIRSVPFPIFPDSSGLLPWGNDENGNEYYWRTDGNCSKWTCVAGEGRGPDWDLFQFPMTTFLAKALSSEIRVGIWPDDYPRPSETYCFEPF